MLSASEPSCSGSAAGSFLFLSSISQQRRAHLAAAHLRRHVVAVCVRGRGGPVCPAKHIRLLSDLSIVVVIVVIVVDLLAVVLADLIGLVRPLPSSHK